MQVKVDRKRRQDCWLVGWLAGLENGTRNSRSSAYYGVARVELKKGARYLISSSFHLIS